MKKAEWTRQFWIKALAFILAVLLVPVIVFNGVVLIYGYDSHWVAKQPESIYAEAMVEGEIFSKMSATREYYANFGDEITEEQYFMDPTYTNYRFAIYDEDDELIIDTLSEDGVPVGMENTLPNGSGRIVSGISKKLQAQDSIYWAYWLAGWFMRAFSWATPVLIVSFAAFMFLIIFLARVSGRRLGMEEAIAGWQEKIPLDLYLLADAIALIGLICIAQESFSGSFFSDLPVFLALYTVLILAAATLVLGLWMTVCCRAKLGKWWRNTVVFQVLRLVWRGLRAVTTWIGNLLRALPLVWKTILAIAVISIIELFVLAVFHYSFDRTIIFWALEKIILVPCIIWVALQLRKLQAAGVELASGNLDAKVDTHRMYWDFKRHGENLNDISNGMKIAVDNELKSERLKTELITNVSHDIKTPLTSIINYVDLLKRDPQGENAEEYLEVLDRQSQRLKKLTEDLVEVSKASTGNMAVNPTRCDIRELLSQALGEYSERLETNGIEAVLDLPEQELFAWADGTLIWRVLDNLLSNACKYSLPGTRLYIDAKRDSDLIRISFKNISREKLNISADELMERFVRGDASRGGEGSGLGLNIARSLMELMKGTLELTVDGDLFRADLTLPAVD